MDNNPEVISNHPHYNIYYGSSIFYMDKISGKPLKALRLSVEYYNDNEYVSSPTIIKKYITYNSFKYDGQGRVIRFIEISKPIQRPGANKTLIKEFQWNDDNQLILYKDNKGNHYEKAWGIKNPYTDKYPTKTIKQLRYNYKKFMDAYEIVYGPHLIDVSYTIQSQGQ